MSKRATLEFAAKFLAVAGAAAILASAAPALAVDPVIDPMRPNEGLTATAPRQAERETRRDLEKTPTLTERFGLPPLSGALPLLLVPPPRQEPVLLDPGRAALPPPPQPRPLRARQPRDRDG